MLKVAHASTAFAPRTKTQSGDGLGDGYALLLETDVAEPVELVDEMLALGGDGDTSREHSQEVTADFAGEEESYEAEKKAFAQELEDYEDDDSDYAPQEEDESEEDDDEEEQELLRTLESALDEHADEVGDFYLKRMLEQRDSLDADEAAWVDSYVVRQREWKEKHGTSIDEMDLDVRLGAHISKTLSDAEHDDALKKPHAEEDQSSQLNALMETLNGRALPYLPPSLRNQPTELILSLVAVVVFLGIAVAVQFYVAFKEPLYS